MKRDTIFIITSGGGDDNMGPSIGSGAGGGSFPLPLSVFSLLDPLLGLVVVSLLPDVLLTGITFLAHKDILLYTNVLH
jgi:hypothetical protein